MIEVRSDPHGSKIVRVGVDLDDRLGPLEVRGPNRRLAFADLLYRPELFGRLVLDLCFSLALGLLATCVDADECDRRAAISKAEPKLNSQANASDRLVRFLSHGHESPIL